MLYIKKERLLKAALAYVEELRDHHVPMLRAAELAKYVDKAEIKTKALYDRQRWDTDAELKLKYYMSSEPPYFLFDAEKNKIPPPK